MKYHGIFAILLFGIGSATMAASADQYELTISNHRFEPAELTVPANARVQLVVHNKDDLPEEFESNALHVEKIILPNQSAVVGIGPLSAGEYEFIGEIHSDTARGRIIAK